MSPDILQVQVIFRITDDIPNPNTGLEKDSTTII